jgi:DNA recombination-dependent growth factor C
MDVRRVPSATLNAKVDLRCKALLEEGLAFIGKEARISMREEIRAELLCKVLPTPHSYELAWDMKGGLLLTSASSCKAAGALTGLFLKSFGCELQPLAPLILAGRVDPAFFIESLINLAPLCLEGVCDGPGSES